MSGRLAFPELERLGPEAGVEVKEPRPVAIHTLLDRPQRRHRAGPGRAVRPGITDEASLKFSNEAEILKGSKDPDKDYIEKIHPEKMRLSLEYVRNRSFSGDLSIIARTAGAIFKPSRQ